MNAYAGRMSPAPTRPHGRGPWIALGGGIVGFVVVMEFFEALMMNGAISEDLANGIGIPIVLALLGLPVVLGARAIRRHATGLPWIPTVLGAIAFAALAVGLIVGFVG